MTTAHERFADGRPAPSPANRVLKALPPAEYRRLSRHLKPVQWCADEALYRPGLIVSHAYFPVGHAVAVISVCDEGEGECAGVGLVGAEGVVGVTDLLGCVSPPLQALVWEPGEALRARADALREEFKKGGRLQELILGHAEAFLAQTARVAACSSAHTIPERVAKWLLMCDERSPSPEFKVTHEFVGELLGVRRAGVNDAMRPLRRAGLIDYRHGHVTVIDRKGLEEASCVCYRVMKEEMERLVGD